MIIPSPRQDGDRPTVPEKQQRQGTIAGLGGRRASGPGLEIVLEQRLADVGQSRRLLGHEGQGPALADRLDAKPGMEQGVAGTLAGARGEHREQAGAAAWVTTSANPASAALRIEPLSSETVTVGPGAMP